MNDLNPYRSPKADKKKADGKPEAKAPSWRVLWIRVKRVIVFLLGLSAMVWSIFAAIKVAGLEDVGGYVWLLYVMLGIVFAIGLFLVLIAVRGTEDDVRDVSLF